ncbi:MAG: serine/threonine protein kinase [Ktedonobacteraceae bacterium]
MLGDWSELINKGLGNYTIQSLIRETHMSAVYYGKELVTERAVAVKVLFPNIRSGSREYRKYLIRFQREAYFIANLRHSYIVPILAYSEYQELAYLVMPFYSNGTLGDLIRQQGRISLQDTARYIEQIAPALDCAHSQNITHRDIKPGNFLVDDNHCLILTDFGIARSTGNPNWATLTTTNKVIGTPEYMAPEILRGKKADPRADIYAMGIVIYEMLHGTIPFTGSDFYAIMDQHFNNDLPSLHSLHPHIPGTVDSVLRKATAKNREDRFMSVKELATALSRAVEPYNNNAPTEVDLSFLPLSFSPQGTAISPTALAGQVGMPGIGHEIVRPSAKFFVWALIITLLAITLIVFGVTYAPTLFSSSQSTVTPTPTLTLPQQAQATVQEYYENWNKGAYLSAYNLLSPTYQKGYAYQRSNYQHVHYSCTNFGPTTPLSDGTVQVIITINAIEDKPSGPGTAINAYAGYFIAQQIQGRWRITPYLQLKSTHGSCIEP